MSIVAGVIVLAFAAILVQLCKIQWLDHDKYERLGRRQHFTRIKIPVRRGTIFDCGGTPLSISLPVHSLYADPQSVEHKSLVAWRLAPPIGMEAQDVFARLIRDRRFVWLKRKLSDEEYGAVRELRIGGIGFRREYRRVYPQGLLLGQVIGFCGIDDNGLAGLELGLERHLSGRPGHQVAARDAAGTTIAASKLNRIPASNGLDVILTIDANIQRIVEEELDKACQRWRPRSGAAVAMEPATGAVLALANWPFFDPNAFSGLPAAELRRLSRNRAVLDLYEPGSTFKPFVVCGALEEKTVTPGTIFDCENGSAVLNGRRLRDAHPHGDLTVSDIIAFSSNLGAGKIAIRLGERKLYKYIRAFGFGDATGLPVKCEPAGLLRRPEGWSKYTITSIPIGQEVSVTPVQLTAAYSAIAAGGRLMKPRLIESIIDPDTNRVVKEFAPELARQAVSPETARKVTRMLVSVIEDPRGTGRRARLEGHTLAGKTGTAQQCLPGNRGYSSTDYVPSFVAFAPADQPRVCVLVKIDTPRGGSHYGGTVAAPAVREIIRRTLAYMNVPTELERLASKAPG